MGKSAGTSVGSAPGAAGPNPGTPGDGLAAASGSDVRFRRRLLNRLTPVLGIGSFAFALWVLFHELGAYHREDIARALAAIPSRLVLLAAALTALDYLVLTVLDLVAFRTIGRWLAYPRVAFSSFIGYAFSHTMGMLMLSGGAVRYRLCAAWGLSPLDIARFLGVASFISWLGFLAVAGLSLAIEPPLLPAAVQLPSATGRWLGAACLVILAAYLVVASRTGRTIRIRSLALATPGSKLALAQVASAALDWVLAAGVLYALLLETTSISFPRFVGLFMLAQVAGLASTVPGGLGVFETVMLVLIGTAATSPSAVVGALLLYRVIYYLIPLATAAGLLATYELRLRRDQVRQLTAEFAPWLSTLVPNLLAFTTFAAGVILLVSGATPSIHGRLSWLKDFLPLPVIETSHFLGSLVGVGLLLLARGLSRRYDAAYFLTVILLAAGAVLSVLKGLDYEESVAQLIMLALLLPARRHFYRRASLLDQPFTPGWLTAIGLVLIGTTWLGFFSYKHVDYSADLWWHFSVHGDAPRFLRATVGAIGLITVLAVSRLLRSGPARPAAPQPAETAHVREMVKESPKTYANLALLGDKSFLFSTSGKTFIMYGVEGRSWVAMGDPVGPVEEWPELLWRFRELCDRYDGWPVFFQIEESHLALYLDLGLSLARLGEEAVIDLGTFSLAGSERKAFRHIVNRIDRAGCRFEILPAEAVPAAIAELRAISDAWLAEKNTREKSFSLGRFDHEYLRQFPLAIVRCGGSIVAFANVWESGGRQELSFDLMRHRPEAPDDVMKYLLIQLALWGKTEGYRSFNLGMAPLSGIESRGPGSLWNRVGMLIYRHGEHFYNFQGLRRYKDSFDPLWKPLFLASPGALALPTILTNIGSLISSGLRGMVSR